MSMDQLPSNIYTFRNPEIGVLDVKLDGENIVRIDGNNRTVKIEKRPLTLSEFEFVNKILEIIRK